jgi:uncharacterized protein YndB with AHSA1/START domain
MAPGSTDTGEDLRLERVLRASPERVFDAWVDPAILRRWWAAQPDWRSPEAATDPSVGGRYRLSMEDTASGEVRPVVGEYLAVDRPARPVSTWTREGEEAGASAKTVVTVEFHADADGTRVVIERRGFRTGNVRDLHRHGWTSCLDNLARRVFNGAPPAGGET